MSRIMCVLVCLLLCLAGCAQLNPLTMGEGLYVAGTLEPKALPADLINNVEDLFIDFDSVDCTTFVEYVSAARLAKLDEPKPTDEVFKQFVQKLRYRQGIRGNYATRKHYFAEWILDNEAQGLLADITMQMEGVVCEDRKIDFMSTHTSAYKQLDVCSELVDKIKDTEIAISRQKFCYIPTQQIFCNYQRLNDGDIVAFVTSIKGLDVQHVGFVWKKDDAEPRLLHASSAKGRVVISDNTLAEYAAGLKNCKGIKVIRLKD